MASGEWTDRLGSVASSACAVHCAVCAFLPVAFSAAGLGFLLDQQMEWLLSIVAIVFGLVALVLGWSQHRSTRVAGFLILGIVGILTSRGLEMGSDHHGHADEAHHEASADASTEEHGGDEHPEAGHGEHSDEHDEHDEHADGDAEHEDSAHLAGGIVGVFAGLLLLFGHILNIRAVRRCREDCST